MKRIKIRTSLLFAITMLLVSCGDQGKEEQPTMTKSSVNGIWKSIGSGWILQITDSTTYSFFDITPISCLPQRKGKFEEIGESLTIHKDTLSLKQGTIRYQCLRTDQLPKLCQSTMNEEKARDILFNFDVFAETVKEHYAFLKLNRINWDSLYTSQRGKLSANSTNAELYLVIEETFEILNDNHAFLEATDDVYAELDELEAEEVETEEDLPEYGDFTVAKMVADHHFQEDLTEDSGIIQWGKMTDEIGFVQVKAMWLFADLEMPQKLIDSLGYVEAFVQTRAQMYEGDYIQKEIEGVNKILDRVMDDLADTKSMVVDVRFNGGGQDAVSFEILSRFNRKAIQVASQQFRYGNRYTAEWPIHLKGTKHAYTKPVYILTSGQSGSAAESFAIATMSMTSVQRIGSATEGALSTTLDKTLPNGWEFCVSNEIYRDNSGKFYENVGIPVDYELNYSRDRQAFFRSVINDLAKDKQDILHAVQQLSLKQ